MILSQRVVESLKNISYIRIISIIKIILKKNKKSYEFIFEIIDLYDQIVYQKNYSSLKGTVEEFLKMLKEVLKKDQEIVVICLSLPGVCNQGMIDLCDFEDFQNKNILEILKRNKTKNNH